MIPKIIHQIWIGDKPIPVEFLEFQRKWKEIYNDYQYILWDDKNLIIKNIFDEDIISIYNSIPVIAGKCDLLRYALLYKFGGIYIDMDTEPLKKMNFLNKDLDFFSGYQLPNEIANGLFGCSVENLIIKNCLEQLEEHLNETLITFNHNWNVHCHQFTGPIFFTKMIQMYKNDLKCVLFKEKYFYPSGPGEHHRRHENFKETSPDAYSVHHWAHSWKDY